MQKFGGSWTEYKLEKVAAYLNAYTTALKNKKFSLVYIDAFAGTGSSEQSKSKNTPQIDLIGSIEDVDDLAKLTKGSAQRAMETSTPFDKYFFIEKDKRKLDQLQKSLEATYAERSKLAEYVNADANNAIVELCKKINWKQNRGVLFLDPFGMQVDWSTLSEVMKTKAIDVWYLIPTGIGIGRLIPKDGKIPATWSNRLDRMLGTHDWEREFYQKVPRVDLFDQNGESLQRSADISSIEMYVIKRLKDLFPAVSSHIARINNRQNFPMFGLTFACSNPDPKAYGLALKLADHILKK